MPRFSKSECIRAWWRPPFGRSPQYPPPVRPPCLPSFQWRERFRGSPAAFGYFRHRLRAAAGGWKSLQTRASRAHLRPGWPSLPQRRDGKWAGRAAGCHYRAQEDHRELENTCGLVRVRCPGATSLLRRRQKAAPTRCRELAEGVYRPRTKNGESPDEWMAGRPPRRAPSGRVQGPRAPAGQPGIAELILRSRCSRGFRFAGIKGFRFEFTPSLLHQDFHPSFRLFQLLLANRGKFHALLVELQSFFEREVSVLQLLDNGVQALKIFLKRFGFSSFEWLVNKIERLKVNR